MVPVTALIVYEEQAEPLRSVLPRVGTALTTSSHHLGLKVCPCQRPDSSMCELSSGFPPWLQRNSGQKVIAEVGDRLFLQELEKVGQ